MPLDKKGRSEMGKVIAIANQKGGVGKTTTCINLGSVLSGRGKRVLFCDMDPQGNCTSGLGVDKETTPNMYDVLINGVKLSEVLQKTPYGDVIPANIQLSGCSVELVEADEREFVMKNALAELRDNYDYILIDCPPSLELLTVNALVAADSVLVPVQCEYFALEGIKDLLTTVEMAQKHLNPELEVEGIIMTMHDSRLKLSSQVIDEVRKYFGDQVYKAVVPRNVRLSEAPSHGKPVIAYDRMSTGSRAYYKLASELLWREKKKMKIGGGKNG
jgi:chromosome partitioning protein